MENHRKELTDHNHKQPKQNEKNQIAPPQTKRAKHEVPVIKPECDTQTQIYHNAQRCDRDDHIHDTRDNIDTHMNVDETHEDGNGLFSPRYFLIVERGTKNRRTGVVRKWKDLSQKRVGILHRLITENGGKLLQSMSEIQSHRSNVIVVSESITRSQFDELFNANIQNDPSISFVVPDFISLSLQHRKKLALQQFAPKCLTTETITQLQQQQHTDASQQKPQQTQPSEKQEKLEADVDTENDEELGHDSHTQTQVQSTSPKHKQGPQKQSWVDRNKESFACQIENDGQKFNHNEQITRVLDEMVSVYACLGDQWREYSYKKVVGCIKKFERPIQSEKDIEALKKNQGFSKEFGKKVMEIVTTGTLQKLTELKAMPQIKTIQLFSNIFGVGHSTAMKWFSLGLRTLDDVRSEKFGIQLQHRQLVGLKYFDDLLLRIPRSEVRAIEQFVAHEIQQNVCRDCKYLTCGSYRRGAPNSGDIDMLFTHRNAAKTDGLLQAIVDHLHSIGFLVADLGTPSGKSKHSQQHQTYMGVCKLASDEYTHYRHIDIKVYRPQYYAFAVLYFTGSDHFNRSMRYYAKKKGYTLSDTHLAKAIRVNREKIHTFEAQGIQCKTEQEIFAALGLKYIEPTNRNAYGSFGQAFSGTGNEQQTVETTAPPKQPSPQTP